MPDGDGNSDGATASDTSGSDGAIGNMMPGGDSNLSLAPEERGMPGITKREPAAAGGMPGAVMETKRGREHDMPPGSMGMAASASSAVVAREERISAEVAAVEEGAMAKAPRKYAHAARWTCTGACCRPVRNMRAGATRSNRGRALRARRSAHPAYRHYPDPGGGARGLEYWGAKCVRRPDRQPDRGTEPRFPPHQSRRRHPSCRWPSTRASNSSWRRPIPRAHRPPVSSGARPR